MYTTLKSRSATERLTGFSPAAGIIVDRAWRQEKGFQLCNSTCRFSAPKAVDADYGRIM